MPLGEKTIVTTQAKSWLRSWRQEIYTDLGSDFRFVGHMESVTTLEDGSVVHTPLPQVSRAMSQIGTYPRVQQLAALLTELIGEWMAEDAKQSELPTE